MTEYTENYNLGKQTNKKDKFDMSIISENWDILDDCMKNFDERISESANAVSAVNDRLTTLESGSAGGSGSSNNIVILSQSEYDALITKTPDTIYMIAEEGD
ncbi:MAG: hypothetical protein K2O60_06485 [Ruminococcus sp.]|nr:hypothetical protein [Ruminococcus sp.]